MRTIEGEERDQQQDLATAQCVGTIRAGHARPTVHSGLDRLTVHPSCIRKPASALYL